MGNNMLVSFGRRFHVTRSDSVVALNGQQYKLYSWEMLEADARQGAMVQYVGTLFRLADNGDRQEYRTFAVSRGDAFSAWRVAIEA